jgi:NAD(P)-dependent dehydrogenase (short-subunit alcohol dehydrogenase family)
MARVFAGHGAKVLIVARHLKDAEAAAEELSKAGATVDAFAADVTKLSDMEAMVKEAVDRHGGLDVLCANAGILPKARIEEMSPESWERRDRVRHLGRLRRSVASAGPARHRTVLSCPGVALADDQLRRQFRRCALGELTSDGPHSGDPTSSPPGRVDGGPPYASRSRSLTYAGVGERAIDAR